MSKGLSEQFISPHVYFLLLPRYYFCPISWKCSNLSGLLLNATLIKITLSMVRFQWNFCYIFVDHEIKLIVIVNLTQGGNISHLMVILLKLFFIQ